MKSLRTTLTGVCVAYPLVESCIHRSLSLHTLGPLLLLGAAAAASTRLASERRGDLTLRASFGWVLAAMLAVPGPAASLVYLLAAGGARIGRPRPWPEGWVGFCSGAVAVAVGGFFARVWSDPTTAASAAGLLVLAVLFLLVQAVARAVAHALTASPLVDARGSLGRRWRETLAGTLHVPLAWIVAAALVERAWGLALAAALVGLALAAVLRGLDHQRGQLESARQALAARVTELATLRAIGREILSTLDLQRVFALIERECRKIFEVDLCEIALQDADGRGLRAAYRRRRGARAETRSEFVDDGVTRQVALRKQGLRIADFSLVRSDSPLLRSRNDGDMRSAMAAPLVVEDRVIGVLSVQSRLPNAYDEHRLAVLMTIAQQAAVAIENARHFEAATIDSLTGFHARDYFFRRLEEERRRVARYGGRFAVLMVDLDGFKEINDRCGHLAGDEYLRQISRTIRAQLRRADLPCRYGGDEFCLLLPETDLPGARAIAERIRAAVAANVVGAGGELLQATVSIGVSAYPDHDTGDLGGLLRNADAALYDAKRSGRDRVVPFSSTTAPSCAPSRVLAATRPVLRGGSVRWA